MSHPLARRLGVLVTAGAVTASALSLVSAGSAQAVTAGADPAPAIASAAWLKSQLRNGRLTGPYAGVEYDNGSIDAGLGLHVVGGQDALISTLSAAVASTVGEYVGTNANTSAGGTAKTAYFVQQTGGATSSFGGVELIKQLVQQVTTDDGASKGRIFDDVDPNAQYDSDYANVLGQSFAALALAGDSNPLTGSVTGFLLDQQCDLGFFTQDFAAAGQTCASTAGAVPSVDTTAIAVLALAAQPASPKATAALSRALTWLKGVQAGNGSFTPDGATGGGNANSTGYAGWALGTANETAAATKAALWIRGQQLANAGSCAPYAAADNGAVAADAVALAGAAHKPIASNDDVATQFRLATAQTLAALAWAPGGKSAGDSTLAFEDFAKAGAATAAVSLTGAPGNTLCATAGGQTTRTVVGADGTASFALALPIKRGAATLSVVDAGGETDAATIKVLGKKKLELGLKNTRVTLGAKLPVKLKGLAPGEQITVKLRGKKVVTTANAQGKKTVRIKVTGRPGKATLKVKGQFGTRKGKTSIRVTR